MLALVLRARWHYRSPDGVRSDFLNSPLLSGTGYGFIGNGCKVFRVRYIKVVYRGIIIYSQYLLFYEDLPVKNWKQKVNRSSFNLNVF